VTSTKHQEANRPNSSSRIEGPTIAVVDDEIPVCDSIRALLEVHGAYVGTYQGGIAFLRASPKVDCLILDYDMPGLTGLDVISELRTRDWTTPTILITAIDHSSVGQRALQLGIQLVKKSSGPQALLQAIRAKLEEALCPRNIDRSFFKIFKLPRLTPDAFPKTIQCPSIGRDAGTEVANSR
jgi:FixJ family two-component response regulator